MQRRTVAAASSNRHLCIFTRANVHKTDMTQHVATLERRYYLYQQGTGNLSPTLTLSVLRGRIQFVWCKVQLQWCLDAWTVSCRCVFDHLIPFQVKVCAHDLLALYFALLFLVRKEADEVDQGQGSTGM